MLPVFLFVTFVTFCSNPCFALGRVPPLEGSRARRYCGTMPPFAVTEERSETRLSQPDW